MITVSMAPSLFVPGIGGTPLAETLVAQEGVVRQIGCVRLAPETPPKAPKQPDTVIDIQRMDDVAACGHQDPPSARSSQTK